MLCDVEAVGKRVFTPQLYHLDPTPVDAVHAWHIMYWRPKYLLGKS